MFQHLRYLWYNVPDVYFRQNQLLHKPVLTEQIGQCVVKLPSRKIVAR